ncbi:MAG: hypothetical protein R3B09_31115 [Nannocystaceae bacterium]
MDCVFKAFRGLVHARALGLSAGLLAAISPMACHKKTSEKPGECAGMCGKGTRCDGAACVVDYSQDICGTPYQSEPEVEMEPPVESWGVCDQDRSSLPAFVAADDSKIPQFDANATMVLDMNAGTERLRDDVLNAEMRKIEHEINACLNTAACYNGGRLGSGEIGFRFRVMGNGTVHSVSIEAPQDLTVYGVVPCARKVIFQHKFPKFDGQNMVVKYTIELE